MEQFLDFFRGVAAQWGLLIVFAVTFLETSAMIGLLMPGEVTVLLAGALAAQGVIDFTALVAVVSLGAILGDNCGYWVGRQVGRDAVLRHGRIFRIREEHFARADGYFDRHGGKTILFGRWIGFLRSLAPFIAGSARMSYPRFFAYDLVGAVSWAVASCVLGYFFGESYQRIDQWLGRISIFLAFLVVLAVILWFLGRWLWRRRDTLVRPANALADRVLDSYSVTWARRRFGPQLDWFFRRFSPRSAYGLVLTAGLLVAALFAWTFAIIFEQFVAHAPINALDRVVAVTVREHAYPQLTQAMKVVTFFGGGLCIAAMTVVVGGVLAWRRMWRDALVLGTAVGGAALLMTVLKVLIQRPRPDLLEPLVSASGYSFPSGHATTSTAFYLTLGLLAAGWVLRWETRIYILLGSATVIALIGFSRIYLGVHYLGDVLAGFALGAFWVAVCVTAGTVFMRARQASSSGVEEPSPSAGALPVDDLPDAGQCDRDPGVGCER